jgi:Tryptophan-rich sensory protein (mitochondrial benzodiazepine receptor homolog)
MFTYIKKHWVGLLVSIIIAELVGFMAGLLSGNTRMFYQQLNQPPLAPPGWLFGVVWPILYAFMGIAAYIVYDKGKDHQKDTALSLYNIQLIVNFMWSIVFFRFQLPWVSVLVILLLDVLVVLTILAFNKIDEKAAWFLYPYLAWILFATYLNIGIAILN